MWPWIIEWGVVGFVCFCFGYFLSGEVYGVIDWPWWLVVMPLWGFGVVLVVICTVFTLKDYIMFREAEAFRKEIEKYEQRFL